MNYLRSLESETKVRFFSEFIVKFSSFLIIPIITYKIGIKEYGEYVLILCIINGIVPVLLLGLNFSIIKKLAFVNNIKINTIKLFSSFSLISFFSLLLFSFFLIISTFNYRDFFLINILISFISYFTSIQLLFYEFLRSKLKSNLFCYFQIFDSVFLIFFTLIIDFLFKLNLIKFLYILTFLKVLIIFLISLVIIKLKIINLKFISLDKNLTKKYIYPGLIFVCLGISEWLLNFSDKIILSYFLSPLYLSVYFTAGMFASSLNSVGSVFWWDLFPKFNKLKKKNNNKKIYEIIRKKNKIFIDFSIYIILCLIILSPLIQSYLLNSSFEVSYFIYLIFFMSVFSHQISTGWEFFCYIKNEGKFVVINSIIWGIISFSLYSLVIPSLKIYGALFSLLISKLGYTLSLIIFSRKKGFKGEIIEKESFINMISFSITFFIFIIFINLNAISNNLFITSIIYLIISLILYIFINKILNLISKNT